MIADVFPDSYEAYNNGAGHAIPPAGPRGLS